MKPIHGGNVHAYLAQTGRMPLDFSANINPLGLPPAVRAAAEQAVAAAVHYPDPACTALRMAIAAAHGVPAGKVLCGNGAADLIYRFAYGLRPKTALLCAPTFAEYGQALAAVGCHLHTHALREAGDFRLTAALLPALDGMDALCLCNPNNPTGQTIDPSLLEDILEACAARGIHVLLDECFVDFLDSPAAHTRIPALQQYPRLVILRAFTKLYAMPGLRLGYCLCGDERLLARMDAAGPPWSVSTVAQAAGLAALSLPDFADRARALIRQERAFLKQSLHALGFSPLGEANFLLLQTPPSLPDALAREGILVRRCASFDGLGNGWIRVAIRTHPENVRLITSIARCLHG